MRPAKSTGDTSLVTCVAGSLALLLALHTSHSGALASQPGQREDVKSCLNVRDPRLRCAVPLCV